MNLHLAIGPYTTVQITPPNSEQLAELRRMIESLGYANDSSLAGIYRKALYILEDNLNGSGNQAH